MTGDDAARAQAEYAPKDQQPQLPPDAPDVDARIQADREKWTDYVPPTKTEPGHHVPVGELQQGERYFPPEKYQLANGNDPSVLNAMLSDCNQAPGEPVKSILAEADAIAGQDRSRDYGHPLANHQRIADIWTVQAEKILRPGERFTPRMVVLMMVGLKLAREVNSPKRDNLIDAAGYIKCCDMIDEANCKAPLNS